MLGFLTAKSTGKESRELKTNYQQRVFNFSDLQPIEQSDEDGFFITKSGRVMFAFELRLPEMESWAGGDYDQANSIISSAISQLPVGTYVHMQGVFYKKHFDRTKADTKELGFLGKQNNIYFKEKPILGHKTYVYITFPDKASGSDTPRNSFNTLVSRGSNNRSRNFLMNIESKIDLAYTAITPFVSAINSIDENSMELVAMDLDDIKKTMYQYFNLDFKEREAGAELDRIYRPMVDKFNYLILGDKRAQIISLTKQPKEVATHVFNKRKVECSMMEKLNIDLYFPHIVNQVFLVCDTEKKLLNLERGSNSIGSFGNFGNVRTQLQGRALMDFAIDMRANNETVCMMAYNVIIWNEDEKMLNECRNQTLTAFKKVQAECVIENMDCAAIFAANIPGNAEENIGFITLPTKEAVCYMNMTTSYVSQQGGMMFCDRDGAGLLLDMWNEQFDSKNRMVIGPSGTGKSFFQNHLVSEQYENGDVQLIIDVGDPVLGSSYISIVENLDGLYYAYDPSKPLSFNPFAIKKNDEGKYNISPDKMDFLMSLIQVIMNEENEKFKKNEEAIIKAILDDYYGFLNKYESSDEIKDPVLREIYEYGASMTGFYNFVNNLDEERSKESYPYHKQHMINSESFKFSNFKNICKQFTKGGAYETILNGKGDSISFDNRLICFDLASVKGNKTLYPIVCVIILEVAFEMLQKFPRERKHIIMDEAWSMLSGSMLEFVEYMYRTIRKLEGGICIVTQGIGEILATGKAGEAIIGNSYAKILMCHASAPQAISKIGENFGFSEHDILKVESVQQKNKIRSEFFVKFGGYASMVYSLELSEYSKLAFSTKQSEKAILRHLVQKQKGSKKTKIENALHIMVQEKN